MLALCHLQNPVLSSPGSCTVSNPTVLAFTGGWV